MSEPLRIALVAEGPTDQPLIAAALNAILPGQPFVLTQLQPEPTYPQMGTGWGGVLKWCHAAGARHTGPIDSDPTLELYDLLIIHLDLDVCGKQYADYPQLPDDERRANWGALPIHYCCPPASIGADALASVLQTWLTPATIPPKGRTVLCLPAQSSGTWLAVATLQDEHAQLCAAPGLEWAVSNTELETWLSELAPKAHKIKKTQREYRKHAPTIQARWIDIKQRCAQAERFEFDVRQVLGE